MRITFNVEDDKGRKDGERFEIFAIQIRNEFGDPDLNRIVLCRDEAECRRVLEAPVAKDTRNWGLLPEQYSLRPATKQEIQALTPDSNLGTVVSCYLLNVMLDWPSEQQAGHHFIRHVRHLEDGSVVHVPEPKPYLAPWVVAEAPTSTNLTEDPYDRGAWQPDL